MVYSFQENLINIGQQVNYALERLIPVGDGPEKQLQEAMRYSTMDGGKRLRPFLLMEAASLFNVEAGNALRAAVALEMVHCYSLVHDDLPAMDDDDLRRGRPTCHKAWDEATAILVGDALLTKAFEIMADSATHADSQIRCELIAGLASAAGDHGMVGGQMFDLLAADLNLDVAGVTRLQSLKTGRLILFACEAGAILGKAAQTQRQALGDYARDLGLAFQIADDLLDVEGNQEEVGKELRKDGDAGKATFVSLLGIEQARQQADLLWKRAVSHLDCFDVAADQLRAAAQFVVERRA